MKRSLLHIDPKPSVRRRLAQKVTIIGGPLGAGKTSVLDMFLQYSLNAEREEREQVREDAGRYLVITNDLGNGIDNERIGRWHNQVAIRHIAKDCACCDAQQQFAEAFEDVDAFSHIVIEPSGAARTGRIVQVLPADTDVQVVGVISPADIAAGSVPWRRDILHHADLIAVTRAQSYQQRLFREAIASITGAPVWFLPDPYRKVGPGTPVDNFDDAWRGFLEAVAQRAMRQKSSIFLRASADTPESIGVPTTFPAMSADDLQGILKGYCERAKGVTTFITPSGNIVRRNFDFSYGLLRLHEVVATELASETTVIGTPKQQAVIAARIRAYEAGIRIQNQPVQNVLDRLSGVSETAKTSTNLPVAFREFNETATSEVLGQADRYFSLVAERTGRQEKDDVVAVESLEAEMSMLGDAMYFDTPLVWLMYKAEAYGQEQLPHRPAPVRTWGSLLQHASPKGYICTNRLNYLRDAWERYVSTLHVTGALDDHWLGDTPLHAIADDPLFQRFAALITPEWLAYERSALGKWKNY